MFKKNSGKSTHAIPAAEFYLAAAILLLFEAFMLFSFFVKPNMDGASAAREELYTSRADLQRYRADSFDTAGLAGQLDNLETRIGELEMMLPQALHNEDISIMLGRFSHDANIIIDSISFQERQHVAPADYITRIAGGADASVSFTASSQPYGASSSETGHSALFDDGYHTGGSLSLQGVQVGFRSEFIAIGPFLNLFETSDRMARIKNVTLTRVQEGELKGLLNLEFASLSPDAEFFYPGMNTPGAFEDVGIKDSLFNKYHGFVEDNVDPTILLLSEDEDIDPDFYIVLKASSSNETKVSYGVYPRVETELRSNINNAIRAKLSISGDSDQFDYVYSLASYQKNEKRTLSAEDGKLRVKILSCQRIGDNDNVAILLDVENNTALPLEIIVVNDDVLNPRFHEGIIKGDVSVVKR